jgi:hypothetical protein
LTIEVYLPQLRYDSRRESAKSIPVQVEIIDVHGIGLKQIESITRRVAVSPKGVTAMMTPTRDIAIPR